MWTNLYTVFWISTHSLQYNGSLPQQISLPQFTAPDSPKTGDAVVAVVAAVALVALLLLVTVSVVAAVIIIMIGVLLWRKCKAVWVQDLQCTD